MTKTMSMTMTSMMLVCQSAAKDLSNTAVHIVMNESEGIVMNEIRHRAHWHVEEWYTAMPDFQGFCSCPTSPSPSYQHSFCIPLSPSEGSLGAQTPSGALQSLPDGQHVFQDGSARSRGFLGLALGLFLRCRGRVFSPSGAVQGCKSVTITRRSGLAGSSGRR